MKVNGFEIDDETEEELAKREAALAAMDIDIDIEKQMAECEKDMNEEDYAYLIYDEWDSEVNSSSIEIFATLTEALIEAKGRLCQHYCENRGQFWYPEHYSLMGRIDKDIETELRLFKRCSYYEDFSYNDEYHVIVKAKKKEKESLHRYFSYIEDAKNIADDMWYSN